MCSQTLTLDKYEFRMGVHLCDSGAPVLFSFVALSAARAAANISTREKFPSLQENSGIGPFILLNGTSLCVKHLLRLAPRVKLRRRTDRQSTRLNPRHISI